MEYPPLWPMAISANVVTLRDYTMVTSQEPKMLHSTQLASLEQCPGESFSTNISLKRLEEVTAPSDVQTSMKTH